MSPASQTPDKPACRAAVVYQAWFCPDSPPLPAPDSQTLLASALAAGLPWTSSCRNGSCRVCIRQLEQGQVRYRIDWPGLSAEEKAEGYILPCAAYPVSDLVLKPAD